MTTVDSDSMSAISDRAARKAVTTPALKLDTTITVVEKTGKSKLPPPPARKPKTKNTQKEVNPVLPKITIDKSTRPREDGAKETTTPVMLSIFPTIDAANRSKQNLSVPTPATQYSASIYSQPSSPPQALIAGDGWSVSRLRPTVFQQSPPRVAAEISPHLSKPESLLDLWTIAQGKESAEALSSYTMVLKCKSLRSNSESISLASKNGDLYAANATGDTVSVTRKHPIDPTSTTTIMTPTYESPTTVSPILVALFPLLAEERAVGAAAEIAAEHKLQLTDSTDLKEQAIIKAKQQESGALLWDSDSSNYYFTVPSLNPQPGVEVQATALAIEHKPDGSIEFLNGSSKSLLKLNLINYQVTLQTRAIIDLSSSVYTLDTLVSALLVLLIHLQRHEEVLALPELVAPYFEPPPRTAIKAQSKASVRGSTGGRTTPKPQASTAWVSRLNPYARSQSLLASSPYQTNNSSTVVFDKDIEMGTIRGSTIILPHHIPPMTTPPIAQSGIAPELRASNTGVDLSRFQAYDLDDPDLGRGTKIALRVIYWGFSVMVWILGVFIGVLAAITVALGACLGGGKGSREG